MTPQQQAQQCLNRNFLILDTETTGLGDDDEIVEITIIDTTGKPLLNTLVKPSKPIPAEATAIHSITNEMVKDAPTWPEISPQLCSLISGRNIAIYNADYDIRLLEQTDRIWKVTPNLSAPTQTVCVMQEYAEFYGQRSERGGYKWQKLTAAAEQQGVKIEGTPHRALSDCLTTLGVLKAMAGEQFPHHVNAVLNELKYASEAAAWEPRVYDAVINAAKVIENQTITIECLKTGRNKIGDYLNELKERCHFLQLNSTANFNLRQKTESQRDAMLMAIGGTEDGKIIDITKPKEATEQAVIIIRQEFRELQQLRDLEEIPFGAVEQDHEVAELQRQVDEQTIQIEIAHENNRRNEDCLRQAMAFIKGLNGDHCYIGSLEKEIPGFEVKRLGK